MIIAVVVLKLPWIAVYMLDSHEQQYIHICMQKHNDAMNTSGHRSLEKYTSHFIERVVCERELETEQNCNILTPTLMAITAFLSRSPGLLNRGPGGIASLGHGPHSGIFSPTHLLSNCNCSIGSLRAPFAGSWFSLPHLISNWLETSCASSYIIVFTPTQIPVDSQGYPLDTFDRMHLLFTQVHFLFWHLGWVNMQHI